MFRALTILSFALMTSLAQASETLIVSVNRDAVPQSDIEKAVNDLTKLECAPAVSLYIPYDETAPYHGVVLLEVETKCVNQVVPAIEADGRYTVFENSAVTPTPAVSGRN